MKESDQSVRDSVVSGNVHLGDIQQTIQTTNVDKSTNLDLSSLDDVSEKISVAARNILDFVKGVINRALLFATVTVLVCGFLIYNGNIDLNQLVQDLS